MLCLDCGKRFRASVIWKRNERYTLLTRAQFSWNEFATRFDYRRSKQQNSVCQTSTRIRQAVGARSVSVASVFFCFLQHTGICPFPCFLFSNALQSLVMPSTDSAEQEGHHTDGKVSESSGRFEQNTNDFDAINVLCLESPFKWRG